MLLFDESSRQGGMRLKCAPSEAGFIAVKRWYFIQTQNVNVSFRQLVLKNSDYSGKLKFFGRIGCAEVC